MTDPGLAKLLEWSVKNSDATNPSDVQPPSGLTADALKEIMGGPSEAQLMMQSMTALHHPSVPLDQKYIAFDNFEQLIESLDNTNNMENMGLWQPLVKLLNHEDAEMRRNAAMCCGTAVQNNSKAQERFLIVGGIPMLVDLAVKDGNEVVRKCAITALSGSVRNYQPALDAAQEVLPDEYKVIGTKADDMDQIDTLINKLREDSKNKGSASS